MLDVDAGYMPETSRNKFLVIPDQSEVRTVKKIGFGAAFFKQKTINLNLFGNYDESYSSRENLTDIKSINKHWGATLGYSNKYLPITLDFHNREWVEEEIQTGRKYTLNQKIFGARLSRSFTKRDRNELRYSHDENVSLNQNLFRIANTVDNIDFLSYISLDAKQKYNLNTMVTKYNQYGNTNLKRFQINEAFNDVLPMNFTFLSNYNFFNIHQNVYTIEQHSINNGLTQRLFKSLISEIHYEYNTIKHTVYREFNTKAGIGFNYTKVIPGGQLLLSYNYDRYHQEYTSDPVALKITDEQYVLSDNKIILLRLPNVSISSVVIKDVTGTIFYTNGLDYILIERGKYIEIRRIPGGSIADNAIIYIDYSATQPGTYKYDANTHVFNTGVYLLNNILFFTYRFSTQNYANLEATEFVTLNYFTQNLIGCRIDFKYISGGAEYENYKSSILPYHMMRYYLNFQNNFGKRVMLSLTGNMQDYVMLDEPEAKYQRYLDASGKLIFSLAKQTNLNIDLTYRKQTGRGIELDLLTSKAEVTSIINRLYLTLGIELYRRNYVGEQINFKGAYLKIVRKF